MKARLAAGAPWHGGGAAFDEAKGVAGLTDAARLAGDLVHEGAHEVNATAADADLARIEVGYGGDVEGFALVLELEDDGVGLDLQLDVHLGGGQVAMSVADDIGDGFAGGHHQCMQNAAFEGGGLSHGLDKGACYREHARVARKRE